MGAVILAAAIGLAGGLGAALRHLADRLLSPVFRPGYGLAIVLVNVTGSFALGLVVAHGSGDAARVLAVGLLGGFTTFSTAALDGARMAMAGRGLRFVGHAAGTALVCVAAAWLGLRAG